MCNGGVMSTMGNWMNAFGKTGELWQQSADESQKGNMYYQQKQEALNEGNNQEESYSKKLNSLKGTQNAAMGASGLDTSSGSYSKIKLDTAQTGAEDLNTIRRNALLKAWGYDVKAVEAKKKSAAASRQGDYTMLTAIMSTGSGGGGLGGNNFGGE